MTAANARRFFIVGAPKAGTTSLYHYLDQHPQIYMSPIKEPHFFADEIRVGNFSVEMQAMPGASTDALRSYLDGPAVEKFSGGPVTNWDDYRKLFARVSNETAIGEASTCYLWSPTAPGNIAAAFPDAKILMVLRNPSDRAFSQYRHMLSFAPKRVAFSDHLNASAACSDGRISQLFPFLQFGLYGEQIARYLDFFPRCRLHIAFYDDYLRAPDKFLRDICAFLNVDTGFAFDRSAKHMQATVPHSYALNKSLKSLGAWNLARTLTPPSVRAMLRRLIFQPAHALCLSREERRRLCDFYRPDIQRLSVLLKQDLSAWLTQ